jgi:hypothetical protein
MLLFVIQPDKHEVELALENPFSLWKIKISLEGWKTLKGNEIFRISPCVLHVHNNVEVSDLNSHERFWNNKKGIEREDWGAMKRSLKSEGKRLGRIRT